MFLWHWISNKSMSKISFCTSHCLAGKLVYAIEYLSFKYRKDKSQFDVWCKKRNLLKSFQIINSFYEKSIYITQIEIFRLYRINLPCVDSTNFFCLRNIMNWKMQLILILALFLVRCSTYQIYHERMKFIVVTSIFSKYGIYLWKW